MYRVVYIELHVYVQIKECVHYEKHFFDTQKYISKMI